MHDHLLYSRGTLRYPTGIMKQQLLITGGVVLDPARNYQQASEVLIEDGKILAIEPGLQVKAGPMRVVQAAGCFVCPGFIDPHVHLREPGQEAKETIATGSAAAVAGGYTTILCMPNTQPALDDATQIEFVYTQAARAGLCNVLPMGAITKGRKGVELAEMGLMHEAGAIGVTDDGTGVASAAVMQKAMQYVKMFDGILSQHCEEPSLGAAAGGAMNAGPVATRLGINGLPAAAEELMIARDILLNQQIQARYHVQHISTAGAVELVRRARLQGQRVTTEVAPHHLLLTDAACSCYDTNTKMSPPLRTQKDIDACIQGVIDGTIDCFATDHAPHTQEEKDLEFDKAPFGIVGLETAMALYIKALVQPGHISWLKLAELLSTGAAKVMRITGRGTLAPGSVADVTIFNPEESWTIDPNKFKSKGRNTPFAGWQVKGRVKTTIVGGAVVYEE